MLKIQKFLYLSTKISRKQPKITFGCNNLKKQKVITFKCNNFTKIKI